MKVLPRKRWAIFLCTIFALSWSQTIRAGDSFFFDIKPDHPHFAAITALKQKGVISGFSDNTFQPDKKVNRAEALKIIFAGSGINDLPSPQTDVFPDVSKSDWFAPFVQEGKNKGIVQGTTSGTFAPTRSINQSEALKMILLGNGITSETPKKNPFENVSADEWFAPFYAQAKTRSLLFAPEVNPARELTRGELAEIMYRFSEGAQTYSYPIGSMSYYGDGINGKKTASGETFQNSEYLAAHRTFAFGTHVLVRSLTTGKAVVVKVIDRGPFLPFRHMDLSKAAFSALEDLGAGLTKGEIREVPADFPLGPVEERCHFPTSRETIPANAFTGITLDVAIPRVMRKNEVFAISGKTSTDDSRITAFLKIGDKEQRFTFPVQNGKFSGSIPFLTGGTVNFGVLPGEAGSAKIFPVEVKEALCFTTEGSQPEPVKNLRSEIRNGNFVLAWDSPYSFSRVLFTQNEKTVEFFINGSREFTPPPALFEGFQNGPAEVRVFAAKLSSRFSSDIASSFSASQKLNLTLSQHYFSDVDGGRMQSHTFPGSFSLGNQVSFSGNFSGNIQKNAFVIAPDGSIQEFPLVVSGQKFTFSFLPKKMGTYLIEINGENGIAILNAPLYHQGFAPLLPDYFDLHPRAQGVLTGEINLDRDRNLLLNLINESRAKAGLQKLELQENLNELAQIRSEDMNARDYFAHTNPDGQTVQDLQTDFGVKTSVRENIAIDVNMTFAHEGLMRSAIHRKNILSPSAKYLGLGLEKDSHAGVVITELFSDEILSNEKSGEYRAQILEVMNSKRSSKLATDATLTKLADSWAKKMTVENFFSAESPKGETLLDTLENGGVNAQVQIAFYQYDSLAEFLAVLAEREDSPFLESSEWQEVGIGLYINDLGIVTIVLLLQ